VKHAITSPDAPKAIGPYSSALRAGSLVFISGQIPFDPQTGALVSGDIGVQTRRALENVGALLQAAGLTYAHIVRTTVFLADMNDFVQMNEVYGSFFEAPYPARSAIQAARLPRDARIEIDAIASYDVFPAGRTMRGVTNV
jgi:2-iminobutanoate/2-iminopropanoate deaminase